MGGRYNLRRVPLLAVAVKACEARAEDEGSGETTREDDVRDSPAGDVDLDRLPASRSDPPTTYRPPPAGGHRDVTLMAVSRAPLDKLAAYRARMGWSFPWFPSAWSDFNFDRAPRSTPRSAAAAAASSPQRSRARRNAAVLRRARGNHANA
jgi:hypothetical protein